MPRMQITVGGSTTRSGSSWNVTTQWAVPAGPSSLSAFTSMLQTAYANLAASTGFKAGVGTQYTLNRVHGLYYPIPAGPATLVADGGGAGAAGTMAPAPIPLAIVVSERTGAAGASYRGRSYWPAGVATADGSVSSAVQVLVAASWNACNTALFQALTGGGLSPTRVVYSPKLGAMTPITALQVGNRVDTARGRFGKSPEVYTSYSVVTQSDATPSELGHPGEDPLTLQQVVDSATSSAPNVGGLFNSGAVGDDLQYAITVIAEG